MSNRVICNSGNLAQISLTSISSEVYGPSEDSFALADALLARSNTWTVPPRLCVEVGCGSGYVLTSAAQLAAACGGKCHLIGTDISALAIAATRETLQAHKVQCSYDLVQADLLGPLLPQLYGKIDLLLFNPPYVPTPDEEVTRGGIAAAWAGGTRGRVVIDRLLPQVSQLLSPGGEFFMVTVSENNPQEILQQLQLQGLEGSICLTVRADEELLQILSVVCKQHAHEAPQAAVNR